MEKDPNVVIKFLKSVNNKSLHMRSSQYVEVQLEIGHKATPKAKLAADGHTHDWTVFVRGPENSSIQHFVEKVVFHLHDSFPKPKRVVKDPPYQVSESGYASFELPVEVYFKNKEEPKKICFDYDLYLRLDDAVSHSRREKLTFQNPSNDFKKKLQKAGGVTNESSGTIAKTATITDEKPQTQQTSSSNGTNTTKYSTKASLSGTETKRSKTLGVIPSKDKSLNNLQTLTTTSSSTSSFVSEKPTIPAISAPNNKQFTDLFGTPIQARAPTDSIPKNKESSLKAKCTAIASKGVKNDSKSLHKNSVKNSYSSPIHKVIENKSSKETKDPKVGAKTKDIPKGKREDIMTSNKSKKKFQTQQTQQSQQSPKTYDSNDKKSDIKSSKKRRNSTSSNSSVMTNSSFGGSTAESKLRKESQKLGSIKEKENKKESKKQKVSSKDTNSASGVKKQSSTSTKISFSDNNSSTTIEIKSVKKEKTWDKEVKKCSRSKEFKSSEFKAAKDKLSANTNTGSASLSTNKPKAKPELNCLKSPKVNTNKNLKAPKENYCSTNRERSSSPSSGSLTPGVVGLSSPSTHGPINSMTADIESHESLSPPSSDNTSNAFPFEQIRPNRRLNKETNDLFASEDSDSDQSSKLSPKRSLHSNKTILSRDSQKVNKIKNEFLKSETNKRKRDESKESNKRLDQSKNDRSLTAGPDVDDSVLINELIDMQKKINESTNSDLLQKIVDIIEESGLFYVTKTTFDFDLMKLDSKTVRKLKSYFN